MMVHTAETGLLDLISAHAYRWYRVGGLDYLLKRTDIDGANANHPE